MITVTHSCPPLSQVLRERMNARQRGKCYVPWWKKSWTFWTQRRGPGLGVKLALGFGSEISPMGLNFAHFLHLG